MLKKYLTRILILFFILLTAIPSLSGSTTQYTSQQSTANINICVGSVHDGFCYKVELTNQGDRTITNIQLTIDVEEGRCIFIPQKTYEITSLHRLPSLLRESTATPRVILDLRQ